MAKTLAEGQSEYLALETYSATRRRELMSMLQPYVEATDQCGVRICTLTLVLGQMHPNTQEEKVVRDLMADVFDFMFEGRRVILQGHLEVAYPLEPLTK